MDVAETTAFHLHVPFDLVEEILCRLSVKHLTQLRCVCKSWNSLISADYNFAKKQLRLSTSNHECHYLITSSRHDPPEFHLGRSPISSVFRSTSPTQLRYPHNWFLKETYMDSYTWGGMACLKNCILNERYMDYSERHIMDSSICDGMICFKLHDSSALLCNPSIGKLKILPPLEFPPLSYTLGYDRFTDNYKIIAVHYSDVHSGSRKIEVNVHTLGTDYWRRIQDFPNPNLGVIPGIFVNNFVNWLVCDVTGARFIVSLDLEKESYQKLSLPVVFDVKSIYINTTIGTLRGCLSLLFNGNFKFLPYDVWIMKEFRNEKSWTKLLSFPHMRGTRCAYRALYISEDNQVLVEFIKKEKHKLVVYDSINSTFKNLTLQSIQNNIQGAMEPQIYVESLISPL